MEKDADVEGIFWDVSISDEVKGEDAEASQLHYLRMKIFNERGRDRAKAEILYGRNTNVSGVAGRTIKPDGTVIDMKRDAVFDKEEVKGRGIKLRSKSFTLPDVQPGDIIEYQWRQTESKAVSNFIRLPLQRDIPIQTVRYNVKPLQLSWLPYTMRSMTLHVDRKDFQANGATGYRYVEYKNMPAFHEEPYMPPKYELSAWMLIFYTPDDERDPDRYWAKFGRAEYGKAKEQIKVSGEMKKVAAEVTSGAKTDDEKIHAVYAWVRKNVKNLNSPDTSAAERTAWKENRNSGDTFKQRLGSSSDMNFLFAGMVDAAGLDARLAMVSDRDDMFFSPKLANSYFLNSTDIAIKVGGEWKLYDVSSPNLPCGMLSWREQGPPVLVTDGKDPVWTAAKIPPAAQSRRLHKARLKLDTDGSLTGDVEISYSGNEAVTERARLMSMKPAERDEYVTDAMKATFSQPELTKIVWSGVEDTDQDVKVAFTLRIPDYAQHTGRRLFVQPALFEHGRAAKFTASTRQWPVYFSYPWKEADDIEIELPAGYALDHPDVPAPIVAGDLVNYKVTAKIQHGENELLIYDREFTFDGVQFPQKAYEQLKQIFDAVREGDQHAFALIQSGKGAN